MKRQNLRTVSLIVVTLTYLLIGAAIFGYLESEHEVRQREALELVELIVKRKYNISEDDFTVLTTTVIRSVPHKAGIQWKFPGAFYFATTVVTTIGYGHSTPATTAGRSFCMIYALIGIPLGLVMFQSIGERLNTFVGSALRYAKRSFRAKNPEVTQTNLVMVVSVLSTILMSSMAAVFAKYERWDYFDALYYCFITLTTIGFGDYVALQKESALQSKPEYVALSLIFILFGLSVVSSAVNLLVLKFLTLNTEDERRDEQLRYTANLNPIQLEGDVITSNAGALHYANRQQQQQQQQQHHHLNKRAHKHKNSGGNSPDNDSKSSSRQLVIGVAGGAVNGATANGGARNPTDPDGLAPVPFASTGRPIRKPRRLFERRRSCSLDDLCLSHDYEDQTMSELDEDNGAHGDEDKGNGCDDDDVGGRDNDDRDDDIEGVDQVSGRCCGCDESFGCHQHHHQEPQDASQHLYKQRYHNQRQYNRQQQQLHHQHQASSLPRRTNQQPSASISHSQSHSHSQCHELGLELSAVAAAAAVGQQQQQQQQQLHLQPLRFQCQPAAVVAPATSTLPTPPPSTTTSTMAAAWPPFQQQQAPAATPTQQLLAGRAERQPLFLTSQPPVLANQQQQHTHRHRHYNQYHYEHQHHAPYFRHRQQYNQQPSPLPWRSGDISTVGSSPLQQTASIGRGAAFKPFAATTFVHQSGTNTSHLLATDELQSSCSCSWLSVASAGVFGGDGDGGGDNDDNVPRCDQCLLSSNSLRHQLQYQHQFKRQPRSQQEHWWHKQQHQRRPNGASQQFAGNAGPANKLEFQYQKLHHQTTTPAPNHRGYHKHEESRRSSAARLAATRAEAGAANEASHLFDLHAFVEQSARVLRSTRGRQTCSASSSSLAAERTSPPSSQPSISANSQAELQDPAASAAVAWHLGQQRRSGRPKQRLICKCCCQHSECIEKAIQQQPRATKGSTATLTATVTSPLVGPANLAAPTGSRVSDSQQQATLTEIFSIETSSTKPVQQLQRLEQDEPTQSD